MDADKSITSISSEKASQITAGNDITLPPPQNDAESTESEDIVYLHGMQFVMLAALIGMMVFIVSVEVNIAVTSFVAITRDLGGFEIVSWILSSYQLGFVASIVISAKLSDLFGRKPITAGLIFIFTVFSAGCAAAQTMTQLIVLRAFQGLGGGGCYTLASILIVDSAPPEKYGKYVAVAGIPIAMGSVLGPIIGGAITENTTWRWIFIFNIPAGAVALFVTLGFIPNGFPYRRQGRRHKSIKAILRTIRTKLDIPGTILVLCAVLSFTAGFMEADSRFAWNSAYVITLLIISVVLSVALLIWERHLLQTDKVREPVLPWNFFTNRVMVGILLVMMLVGAPMSVSAFQLPQRFQLVNGLSSLDAGIRLLPFGGVFPLGCMAGTILASKFRVPAIYSIFVGAILQVVGYALLGTLSTSAQVEREVYGYLVLCGFGCGISFTMAYITVPFTIDNCDKAVGMAAANQFRTMGSAMGLAIATSIFNGYTLSHIAGLGINSSITDLITGQQTLPAVLQEDTRRILSEAYNRQMLVLCGFSAAQIPAAMLMWKQKQIVTV